MSPISIFCLILVAALAWFLGTDPLRISMGQGVTDFNPQYVAPFPADLLKEFPRDNENKLQNAEIKWQGQVFGPESLTFDQKGRGPYTGVADGRVLRYDGPELGWNTFAYTSKNRSDVCAPKTPVGENLEYENVCGRPLGLGFKKDTGELWIADAHLGILKVGAEGGQAEVVLTEAEGIPLKFSNALDFDNEGNLYFSESSNRWDRRQFILSILEAEDTGRLIKYNPTTKETTVLIDKLRFPNGVAVSEDGTFIVISETRMARLLRYWLKGEKAGQYEIFAHLPGWPDNVRRNEAGDFWVAIATRYSKVDEFMGTVPWLRSILIRLPISMEVIFKMMLRPEGIAVQYGPNGDFKQILEDQQGKVAKSLSDIDEHDGELYLGSPVVPHIVVYTLPPTPVKET